MLQTKQYNDFTGYDYTQRTDTDFMFDEMKKFVDSGGNLNLAVLNNKGAIISFAEFIKEDFDAEFMGRLLEHNLIKSPFKFTFDKESKSIVEDNEYNLSWMSNNYLKYEKFIVEAVESIAKETNGYDVDTYTHSYNKPSYEKKYHPLFFITSHLQKNSQQRAELWSVILDNNKEIHSYMKEYLSSTDNLERFLSSSYDSIQNAKLANVFYQHNIINDYLIANPSKIHTLIESAISTSNVELFIKLKEDFDIPKIELERKSHESFLRFACTPEIAKEVIDAGCFTWGQWKGGNLDNYKVSHHYSLSDDRDTLSYIINKVDKDFALEHHTYLFNKFFKDIPNLDMMKLLIEKHHFPVENYDVLNSFHKVSGDKLGNIKWAIEHGADPRNCESLLSNIIASRDKKPLTLYKKEGLINPFSTDMIYHFFRHDSATKMFTDYYDKNLSNQDLSHLTKSGKPAWWGLKSQSMFKQFRKRIDNFNQTDSAGNGWVNELFANIGKESSSVILSYLQYAKDKLKEEKLIGQAPEGRNFMHDLLKKTKYGYDRGADQEVINYVFENVDADFKKVMSTQDNLGYYPLTNFFYFYDSNSLESIKDSLKHNDVSMRRNLETLIERMTTDFPFEQKINDIAVIELIKDFYPQTYEMAEPYYRASKLYKELDDKPATKSLKI